MRHHEWREIDVIKQKEFGNLLDQLSLYYQVND